MKLTAEEIKVIKNGAKSLYPDSKEEEKVDREWEQCDIVFKREGYLAGATHYAEQCKELAGALVKIKNNLFEGLNAIEIATEALTLYKQ